MCVCRRERARRRDVCARTKRYCALATLLRTLGLPPHRARSALRAASGVKMPTDQLLPAWWDTASSSLSTPLTTDRSMKNATESFDAPAVSSALCRQGYAVVDGFLGAASATAAVRVEGPAPLGADLLGSSSSSSVASSSVAESSAA